MSTDLNAIFCSVQPVNKAVADVIIDNTAIDLIAFCRKERLFIMVFKVLLNLKNVVIDQQSGK